MSSIILFALFRDPLLVISNSDFESVGKCMVTERRSACSICEHIARVSSEKAAKAMTLAESTEPCLSIQLIESNRGLASEILDVKCCREHILSLH